MEIEDTFIENTLDKISDVMQAYAYYNPTLQEFNDEYQSQTIRLENSVADNTTNANCSISSILIEFGDEFTLHFSSWHTHYFSYEYSYQQMLNDINSILNSECASISLFTYEDKWRLSTLVSPNEIPTHSAKPAIEWGAQKEDVNDMLNNGCYYKIDFWDTDKSEYLHIKNGEVIHSKSREI